MPQSKELRKTVLIVDDDLGFVVWLGVNLATHGFISVPAIGPEPAARTIDELNLIIDLAIVNFEIEGTAEFMRGIKARTPKAKVIAIQDPVARVIPKGYTDASHSKSRAGWLALIRRVLGLTKSTSA